MNLLLRQCEKGERRKEKGERRKEKGERRKEKGERRETPLLWCYLNRYAFAFILIKQRISPSLGMEKVGRTP
jgi:hypothetical protein